MYACVISTLAFVVLRWEVERRKDKLPCGPQLFKMFWFVAIASVEWAILDGVDWLPSFLGGQGKATFWERGPDQELSLFYQVQTAYHVHSMIFAMLMGAKAEMYLHHVVTLVLIGLSDISGYRRVGAVVFMLHDVPDIVGYAVKASMQAHFISGLIVSYGALLFTWAYFRLVLLSQLILDVWYNGVGTETARQTFTILLSTLLVLHVYWYSLFLLMGFKFAVGGKTKDISETKSAEVHNVLAANRRQAAASASSKSD